jgi:hypothetical protein
MAYKDTHIYEDLKETSQQRQPPWLHRFRETSLRSMNGRCHSCRFLLSIFAGADKEGDDCKQH